MFTKAALSSTRFALVLFVFVLVGAVVAGPALSAGSQAEALSSATALSVTPTLFTTIHDANHDPVTSVLAGTTVHDTASVSSLLGPPIGRTSFTWFANGNCEGTGTAAGSASVNSSGFADGSTANGPLAPGDYSFTAHFTSFDPIRWTDADSQCEPLHVSEATASELSATTDANPNFARAFAWEIAKSVDQTRQTISPGSSATFNYTLSISHDDGTDSDWQVLGQITVTNPNNAAVDDVTVSDAIDDPNAACTVLDGNSTIPAGGSATFDYVCTYSAAPQSASQTNTATIDWPAQTLSNFASLPAGSTPAEAPVAWGEPTAILNGSLDVDDSLAGVLSSALYTDPSPTILSYPLTFEDDPVGTCTAHDNTATLQNDALVIVSSNTVTVEVCSGGSDLTVDETATPSFTRTFGWAIDKSVDKTGQNIADGGTATFNYAVDATKGAGVDSGWAIAGTATVTNPNDWDMNASLAETAPGGSCSLAQSSVTVPAGGSVSVGYSCTFADGAPGQSTATVTWDSAAYSTPSGSASGTADYAFDTPTELVNDSVDVFDNGDLLGSTDRSKEFTYPKSHAGVAGTCTRYDNTATVANQSSLLATSNTVTVAVCVGADLTVETRAAPSSFTRTYKWRITKSVAAPSTVTQAGGGTATFHYTVNVAGDGYTDSAWLVTGTITVANPNDWEAITADVTDAVDNGGICTVADGAGVSIPGHGSVTLDYSCAYAAAPSPAAGVNTATATWDDAASSTPHGSALGTDHVAFTNPTTELKSTVTVTDTFNGATSTLGVVGYPGPGTFPYARTVTVPTAGSCVTYPNTATITETGQTAGASVTACGASGSPQTGALTMGYWQNKNGQGLIAAANQAQLLAFLKGYAPFSDASAPLTTYATKIIKAASASGSAMNAMLKAQMLATAFDVYFSNPALGGNKIGAPVPIGGVAIDLTRVPPIGNTSSAFGGATSMTVSQILAYAASKSNAGGSVWYANVKATQELAKDVFDAINNEWAVPA